jgi:hypothetical protein
MKIAAATTLFLAPTVIAFAPSKAAFRPTTSLEATATETKVRKIREKTNSLVKMGFSFHFLVSDFFLF